MQKAAGLLPYRASEHAAIYGFTFTLIFIHLLRDGVDGGRLVVYVRANMALKYAK